MNDINYSTNTTWGVEGKKIHDNFQEIAAQQADIYTIGTPGGYGFGVGCCLDALLPSHLSLMPGTKIKGGPDYGNYIHTRTGGQVVCVPICYVRENDVRNPTYAKYAPNDIDIKGRDVFPTTADAVAAGYRLHRAFVDGGVEQECLFVDKGCMSRVAVGSGYAGAYIRSGLPMSTAADHNPITGLSACSTNNHYQFLNASKGRDSANGEFNQNSPWFAVSTFIADLIFKISLAHGQAAASTAACAWFDPAGSTSFPKGCNNNALKDTNDTTVQFQSDGYSNCGKAGSGVPFAKTTHNGQECGITDISGPMWNVLSGVTCIASSKSITGVTAANPARIMIPAHGLTTGAVGHIASIVGPTALNDKMYTITVVDADTISLDGVDGTSLPAWVSGGTFISGTFYIAKESVRMRDFTSGQTSGTDHWGSVGVAAMMDAIPCPFPAPAGGISISLKFGNGSNRVFASSPIGDAGIPLSTGVSVAGAALFGNDYYYMYFRDLLCAIGFGSWNYSGGAGPAARDLNYYRTYSYGSVSGRAACYPGE